MIKPLSHLLCTIWCLLHSAWKFFTFPSTYFKRENLEETCIISFYFYGYTFLKLEHTVFKTVGKRFLFLWLDSIQLGTYWIFFRISILWRESQNRKCRDHCWISYNPKNSNCCVTWSCWIRSFFFALLSNCSTCTMCCVVVLGIQYIYFASRIAFANKSLALLFAF